MSSAVIAILASLISEAPAAIAAFNALKPALQAGRDPTPEEWAQINAFMDDAHNQVQGA